jgi:molybdopterin molybdotransferase
MGEDINAGTTLLEKGDKLTAHKITLLASQGISHIKVHKRPRIALFGSGNELKMHFETLHDAQLYNTNSPTFVARAKELGCEVEFLGTAKDSLEDLQEHIKSALDYDLIITSGGVSVGDADYTKEAFEPFGYEIYFDKVDIKPGKPTTFAHIGNTMVLNLPGNPLAAALNFELFGKAIIYALSAKKEKFASPLITQVKNNLVVNTRRRTLIPGYFDGEFFTPEAKYAPGMVSPLAKANGFIIVEGGVKALTKASKLRFFSTHFSLYSEEQKEIFSS